MDDSPKAEKGMENMRYEVHKLKDSCLNRGREAEIEVGERRKGIRELPHHRILPHADAKAGDISADAAPFAATHISVAKTQRRGVLTRGVTHIFWSRVSLMWLMNGWYVLPRYCCDHRPNCS